VRRQGGGSLQRVGLDHSLTPCDGADPRPPPTPPWRPCHLVMWSPPTRAPANADEDDDTGDDRPYFHSELSDLTLAPDLYTYHRDGHNVMEYKMTGLHAAQWCETLLWPHLQPVWMEYRLA